MQDPCSEKPVTLDCSQLLLDKFQHFSCGNVLALLRYCFCNTQFYSIYSTLSWRICLVTPTRLSLAVTKIAKFGPTFTFLTDDGCKMHM